MKVTGRTAIVTGAARGIGAGIAGELLSRGARVLITDLDATKLESTAAEFAERFGEASVVADSGNAADEDTIRRWIAAAEKHFGPVDLYVANAGVGDGGGLDATEDDWSRAIEINVMAHVRAARLLVPGWQSRGEGHFLSTASAAGLLTQIGSAVYSVSKHGAVAFAEWLAVTYGPSGIGVSCLCPMGVDTDLLRSMEGGEEARSAQAAVTNAGDVLSPEVVARFTIDAVENGDLLILPHAQVQEFLRRKTADHGRWVSGMQRYAASLAPTQEGEYA